MAGVNPLFAYTPWRVFNGFAPKDLPKTLTVPLDFTVNGSNGADILIDLELLEQEAALEFVQAVFTDNTVSGTGFKLTSLISQQRLTLNAGAQAYLPLLAPPKTKFMASTGGNVTADKIWCQFLNMPVPAVVW